MDCNVLLIDRSEFAQRRSKLLNQLGKGALVLIGAAPESVRNSDVTYPYRQDSNFHYLTGFPESEAIAVLYDTETGPQFDLFNRAHDDAHAKWVGAPIGQKSAQSDYGADHAYPYKEFATHLPRYLKTCTQVYVLKSQATLFKPQFAKSKKSAAKKPHWIDLEPILHHMRLYKSDYEIACLRKAAEISAKAHVRAMRFCRAGLYEYHLEAEFLHECYTHGSRSLAYSSIVASGENACILHYDANRSLLRDGDCILIDAGCEYQLYAADITRTFPINGRFTSAQRAIYQLVLDAQHAALSVIKPGVSWDL
jgi:Xaa-Pro aminopeptidase